MRKKRKTFLKLSEREPTETELGQLTPDARLMLQVLQDAAAAGEGDLSEEEVTQRMMLATWQKEISAIADLLGKMIPEGTSRMTAINALIQLIAAQIALDERETALENVTFAADVLIGQWN
jgi:hypothetical protein